MVINHLLIENLLLLNLIDKLVNLKFFGQIPFSLNFFKFALFVPQSVYDLFIAHTVLLDLRVYFFGFTHRFRC